MANSTIKASFTFDAKEARKEIEDLKHQIEDLKNHTKSHGNWFAELFKQEPMGERRLRGTLSGITRELAGAQGSAEGTAAAISTLFERISLGTGVGTPLVAAGVAIQQLVSKGEEARKTISAINKEAQTSGRTVAVSSEAEAYSSLIGKVHELHKTQRHARDESAKDVEHHGRRVAFAAALSFAQHPLTLFETGKRREIAEKELHKNAQALRKERAAEAQEIDLGAKSLAISVDEQRALLEGSSREVEAQKQNRQYLLERANIEANVKGPKQKEFIDQLDKEFALRKRIADLNDAKLQTSLAGEQRLADIQNTAFADQENAVGMAQTQLDTARQQEAIAKQRGPEEEKQAHIATTQAEGRLKKAQVEDQLLRTSLAGQEQIAQLQNTAVTDQENMVQLAEARVALAKQEEAIASQRGPEEASRARAATALAEGQLKKAEVQDKLIRSQLAGEQRLATIQASGLTTQEKSIALAQAKVDLAREQERLSVKEGPEAQTKARTQTLGAAAGLGEAAGAKAERGATEEEMSPAEQQKQYQQRLKHYHGALQYAARTGINPNLIDAPKMAGDVEAGEEYDPFARYRAAVAREAAGQAPGGYQGTQKKQATPVPGAAIGEALPGTKQEYEKQQIQQYKQPEPQKKEDNLPKSGMGGPEKADEKTVPLAPGTPKGAAGETVGTQTIRWLATISGFIKDILDIVKLLIKPATPTPAPGGGGGGGGSGGGKPTTGQGAGQQTRPAAPAPAPAPAQPEPATPATPVPTLPSPTKPPAGAAAPPPDEAPPDEAQPDASNTLQNAGAEVIKNIPPELVGMTGMAGVGAAVFAELAHPQELGAAQLKPHEQVESFEKGIAAYEAKGDKEHAEQLRRDPDYAKAKKLAEQDKQEAAFRKSGKGTRHGRDQDVIERSHQPAPEAGAPGGPEFPAVEKGLGPAATRAAAPAAPAPPAPATLFDKAFSRETEAAKNPQSGGSYEATSPEGEDWSINLPVTDLDVTAASQQTGAGGGYGMKKFMAEQAYNSPENKAMLAAREAQRLKDNPPSQETLAAQGIDPNQDVSHVDLHKLADIQQQTNQQSAYFSDPSVQAGFQAQAQMGKDAAENKQTGYIAGRDDPSAKEGMLTHTGFIAGRDKEDSHKMPEVGATWSSMKGVRPINVPDARGQGDLGVLSNEKGGVNTTALDPGLAHQMDTMHIPGVNTKRQPGEDFPTIPDAVGGQSPFNPIPTPVNPGDNAQPQPQAQGGGVAAPPISNDDKPLTGQEMDQIMQRYWA